jgi:hypothetical protein
MAPALAGSSLIRYGLPGCDLTNVIPGRLLKRANHDVPLHIVESIVVLSIRKEFVVPGLVPGIHVFRLIHG